MGNTEIKKSQRNTVSERATGLDPGLALLNSILDSARKLEASAVHLYLQPGSNSCFFEVAGKLQPTGKKLNNKVIEELAGYIKLSANLEASDLSHIQTARLELDNYGCINTSLISSPELGKSHLMLFLSNTSKPKELDDLGFWGKSLELLESALDRKKGIILFDSTDRYTLRTIINSSLNYLYEHQSLTSVSFDSSLMPDTPSPKLDRIYTAINAGSIGLAKRVLATAPAVVVFQDTLNADTLQLAIEQSEGGRLVFIATSEGSVSAAMRKALGYSPDIAHSVSLVISASQIQTITNSNGSHPLRAETISQIENYFQIDLPNSWRSIYSHAGIKSPADLLSLDFPVASKYGGVTNLVEVFKPSEDIGRIINRNPGLSESTLQSIAIRSGMLTKKEDGLIKALRKEVDLADVIDTCK